MAEPIIISDDSDTEWNSSYINWNAPQPLDSNFSRAPASSSTLVSYPMGTGSTSTEVCRSVAATSSTTEVSTSTPKQEEPMIEPLVSPINPNLPLSPMISLCESDRPLDLIDLTDNTGMMIGDVGMDASGVIDLTQTDDDNDNGDDEDKSLSDFICPGRNAPRGIEIDLSALDPDSLLNTTASEFNFCLGTQGLPECERLTLMSEGTECDNTICDQESLNIFQGFMSPAPSYYNSYSTVEQPSGSTFERDSDHFESFQQNPDVTTISTSSRSSVTLPCMLENFYQVILDTSEERMMEEPKPEPIPQGRVQIIINTIEANFSEATLQCLEEFVTPQFFPPMEILSHVIRKILLGPSIGTLVEDTYKLLIRIQEMHPASFTYVAWDWDLMTFAMQEQECEKPGQVFFLRYVLQTMDDDFQNIMIKPRAQVQDTIASSVISCDKQPQHIKDIIRWMIRVLAGPGFPEFEKCSVKECAHNQAMALAYRPSAYGNPNQEVILYLQKFLAMAVEVDRTPTCTSSRIAEMLFGFVLNIPERSQREMFFTSMENHLLRSKVLEIVLIHSCDRPTTMPLSYAQILYFLNNATILYNQTEGVKWESWDELVEHLQFLLISYHKILTEHLRTPVRERKDINRRFKPPTQQADDITALDVEMQIEGFRGRMVQVVGGIMPFHLQEKLFLLKLLFLQAIHGKPLLESRLQGGHLMRARTLLNQEYPNN
uniref:SUMO interacting motifs containing 1 n=1 Tax=Sarcophilus harrisii TaxID=9305 RepID=A0A7N4PGU0_SARHA